MLSLRSALLLWVLACAAAAPARRRRVRGLGGAASASPNTCGAFDRPPASDLFVVGLDLPKGANLGKGYFGAVVSTTVNGRTVAAKRQKDSQAALIEFLAGAATCAPGVAPCADGTPVMRYEGCAPLFLFSACARVNRRRLQLAPASFALLAALLCLKTAARLSD